MLPNIRRNSDIILALFVVAITAMLLIPLPTPLLDFLLAANISFALLLLLVGLYMPNALALLAFPSLLLLTTLFRLGLNVASTRLILSQGYAGHVIEAFGTFLIQGEIIVGIIIFLIITIVNFIVIARGSSRVSEVAARFALDSLPGKQLAIDSDVRAGTITPEQAQRRRDDLRKESQLFGAMDGAMKFVQGDAIAGLFIIFTNIVGGIYLGLSNGLSLSEAVQTYSVLTIGDGLVSQVPAILISICAGIVVTRVSSGENTTLGADVGAQIFSRAGTLAFAGALCIIIALLPGLPSFPFITVGLVFLGFGLVVRKRTQDSEESGTLRAVPGELRLPYSSDTGFSEVATDRPELILYLDNMVLHKLYQMNVARYRQWWRVLQSDAYSEMGIRLPELSVVAADNMTTASFSVFVDGSQIDADDVPLDSSLVEVNPDNAILFGLQIAEEASHPLTADRIFWAQQTPVMRRVVDAANIRTLDFFEYIALRIFSFFLRNPQEAISISDVHSMLKMLEKKYPGLLGDALNRDYLSVPRITDTLQELVREGLSIKDFKQIIEAMASYCSTYGSSLNKEDTFDLQDLVASIRQQRKRQMLAKLISSRSSLKVFMLSNELENVLDGLRLDSNTGNLPIEPSLNEGMRAGLASILEPLRARGLSPISVLCRSDLRPKVIGFLRSVGRIIPVVTFEELDSSVRVESVALWTI